VRSVARRTAHTTATAEEYAAHLDGRINALARTQSVLTRTPGAGVDLEEMVSDELVAHAAEAERVHIEGPPIQLQAKAAETLGLGIHELATNAVKYGALAAPEGRVSVTWRIERGETDRLRLQWREEGVAMAPEAPRRRGFGTELLERTLPYELDAKATIDFLAGGVCATIDLPLNDRVVLLVQDPGGERGMNG
jgi:two-component system CheB/CheR fusion protein